jgi:hypothetical protein
MASLRMSDADACRAVRDHVWVIAATATCDAILLTVRLALHTYGRHDPARQADMRAAALAELSCIIATDADLVSARRAHAAMQRAGY